MVIKDNPLPIYTCTHHTQIWIHTRIFRWILWASISTFQSQEQFFLLGGNETQLAWVLWRGHNNKDADLCLITGPEAGNTIYVSMILLCEHFYLGGLTHCHPILLVALWKLEDHYRQIQDNAGGVWMLTATTAMQKIPCFIGFNGGSAAHCRSFSFLKRGHYPAQTALDLWSSCLSLPQTGIADMCPHPRLSCRSRAFPSSSVSPSLSSLSSSLSSSFFCQTHLSLPSSPVLWRA